MIFMPQLLYILHMVIPLYTAMVIPLKIFCIINSIFRSYGRTSPPESSWNNFRNPKMRAV